MSATDSKLLEFRLFPELPYELRLEIWKYALLPPRAVELRQTGKSRKRRFWITDAYPSALLKVCHEAREVTLESYKPILAWNQTLPVLTSSYIAYSKDTVCLSDSSYTRLLDGFMSSTMRKAPVALDKVQYLAVISDPSWGGHIRWSNIFALGDDDPAILRDRFSRRNTVKILASIFRHFKDLKQLLLVTDKYTTERKRLDELLEPTDADENCCEKRLRKIRPENLPELLEALRARDAGLSAPSGHFKILIKSHRRPWQERRCSRCLLWMPGDELKNLEFDSDD